MEFQPPMKYSLFYLKIIVVLISNFYYNIIYRDFIYDLIAEFDEDE